jgi:single-strand DNA-binding protein
MSVRSLNKVMLIGNLTRDPNMRYTPNNTAVCTFGIATNRSWTPADGGEKVEKADFHNIVAWSKLAELCGQLLKKGDKVYVEGRLQTRDWKGKDELDHRTTEIIIDNMILLTSRGGVAMSGDDGTMSQVSASDQSASSAPKKRAGKKAVEESVMPEPTSDMASDVSDVEDLADEVDIPF